ncbi:hypothetical protein [Aeromicrobium sp. CnD17-E]|uniref:hypothetical protein n=1 Tax=Aeromicrobium sp. CnD17-E TaxID=2954487 RepID=UPI002097018F|nr:hypothetical protein [Aeromicrobium sp. CnD17-E]MCO7240640.1 hypothetical protein [Aeromicrobium sp. CnD17-E]
MSRYELRLLQWSWGLMVDLEMSVHVADAKPAHAIPVAPHVWLVVNVASGWEGDLPQLLEGLRRVVPRFRAAVAADGGELVFVLHHLWYPLTDVQEGAIELAVAGWAVEELEPAEDPATVEYDRAAHRYVINFDEGMWEAESSRCRQRKRERAGSGMT